MFTSYLSSTRSSNLDPFHRFDGLSPHFHVSSFSSPSANCITVVVELVVVVVVVELRPKSGRASLLLLMVVIGTERLVSCRSSFCCTPTELPPLFAPIFGPNCAALASSSVIRRRHWPGFVPASRRVAEQKRQTPGDCPSDRNGLDPIRFGQFAAPDGRPFGCS